MLGLGLGIADAARRRFPAVAPPIAPPAAAGGAATAFALPPTIHYHPHAQAGGVAKSGAIVIACPDLRGLAGLSGVSAGGAVVGPTEMTDALGRKFWRFEGTQHALLANGLAGLSARGVTVMAAGRVHRAAGTTTIFSPRYSAYTDDATNTAFAGGGVLRNYRPASPQAYRLYGGTIDPFTDAANAARMVPGSELAVLGVCSRATAGGGQRIYLNADVASVAQSGLTQANCTGGVICGLPAAANGVTASGAFDLYEFALWKGELTNAQADAAAAAMVANFAIPAAANLLVTDGDSITQGVGDVPSGQSLGMMLSDPGGPAAMPAGWRVVNLGGSGNKTADLLARRDTANTLYALKLPGRNVMVGLIGRNDVPTTSGQGIYDQIVPLINASGNGYLQRGWEVRWAVNIAVGSSLAAANDALRGLLRAAQFRADTLTGAGQIYEGRLALVDLPAITVAGSGTIFDGVADSTDPLWFQGDSTHPTIAGTLEMAKAYKAAA